MIDRFGKLPAETDEPAQGHRDQAELPQGDASPSSTSAPKGALVHFHNDSFPDLAGLLAYVERLKGTAKLRPDSKLVITRAWPDAERAAQRRAAAVEGAGADRRLTA